MPKLARIGFRKADENDWRLLLNWRNDPLTRKFSRNSNEIDESTHRRWLERCLRDPHRDLRIALFDGTPVGVVRIDREDEIEISWTISPDQRGQGFGKEMVYRAVQEENAPVYATIYFANEASKRIAMSCGFELVNSTSDWHVYRRDCRTGKTMGTISINGREIGAGRPAYVIAELSANHGGRLDHALDVVRAMKDSGADAVKLQTYTADTLTINSQRPEFRVGKGTIWEGRTLYDLYQEAHTPWEWHPPIFELANKLGMDCFSTPFDQTAVDFLETLSPPAYKIASFELVDLPLIQYIASKNRPIIMSTGMGSLGEIDEAVQCVKDSRGKLALLKCTSAYPSPPESMNLRTIRHLAETFDVPTGLSDHTLGIAVPVSAVAIGACIVEKHFIMCRDEGGPDASFSLEPREFREMVDAIRTAEKALGRINFASTSSEEASKVFRRSLFVVENIRKGEPLTSRNVRSIRPGHGLPPKFLPDVVGKIASRDLDAGTPLSWDAIQ